jgi:antitoxin component YwqK of YwqJK toxin-antitoxin module
MKTNFKNSLFYFLIVINISNCIFAQTSKNKIKEGTVTTFSNGFKYITNYKKGIKYGESITYLENGSIYEKGNYVDGNQIGEWITYNKGKVFSKRFYKKGDGNYDIIFCDYPEELKYGMSYVEKGSYSNGKKDGYFIEVEKIGRAIWLDSERNLGGDKKKIGKGHYENGHKEGMWIYYNEKGVEKDKIFFIQDKRDGRGKIIDTDIEYAGSNNHFNNFRKGNLRNISLKDSIDEKKTGKWQFNYNNGFKLIVNFNEGIKSGDWIGYNENNAIVEKGHYINGKMDGEWIYYDDEGTIMLEKGNYTDGIPIGDWIEIDEDSKHNSIKGGDRIEQKKGIYVNGLKEGKWKNSEMSDRNNNKSITYKNGLKDGEYISYIGGVINEIGFYENGIKHGDWIEYKNEQIKSKFNYKQGKVESGMVVRERYYDGSRVEESMNKDGKRQMIYYNNKGEVTKQEIITN